MASFARLCVFVGTVLIALFFGTAANSAAEQDAAPTPAKQSEKKTKASPKKKDSAAKGAPAKDDDYREDFGALPVEKSSLKLDLAVLGEVDDKPGLSYIRERWHLAWRPGDPIDVYILKPRGVEKPPVILYLYSYPQDTDRFKSDSWGAYATGSGAAAVGFVSAFTGHRLEFHAPKDNFFSQLEPALGSSVHDVQMILNYLSTRKDLDMSRVGMFGQGSGGSIAILASAADARIKALDVLTPWGDWPTFVAQSSFIPSEDRLKINTPDYLAKLAPLDPVAWLSKVKAKSLRIQNVRSDNHMPDAAQERLEAVAPDTAEINQYGDRAALVPAAANGRLLAWIHSQFQPDAKPQESTEKSQRIHFFPAKARTTSSINEIH